MTTVIATHAEKVEQVLLQGDLSRLTPEEKVGYYNRVCSSLGLNPLTKPFEYLRLSGREVLYAKRDATEQLRKIHGVSIERLEKEKHDDLYVVTAYARDNTGRTDASTGAVPLGNLKGEALANAIMKCETKAKRRVTLSICGLGMLDETEVESMPVSHPPVVVETPKQLPPAPSGAVQITKHLESVGQGPSLAAKFVLSDGREVVAKGAQLVGLLEQLAQEGAPVDLTTRTVKKRGTQETYELIEEAARWREATGEIATEPVAEVPASDQPF